MKWTNSCKDTVYFFLCDFCNVNRPISIIELESIINNLPKERAPEHPDKFTDEFH